MDLGWKPDKTKKIVDDFSTAEHLFDKHQEVPPLRFGETDTMFILTANLEGYKRENIKVEINKARKQVAVFGEKPVQETLTVGKKVFAMETKIREFKRAFHFLDGVILDKIKARFNEQEFVLTISIPKQRGFRVTRVEEVKQEEIGGTFESLQLEENRVDEIKTSETEKQREGDVKVEKDMDKDVVEVHEEELEKRETVPELDQTQTYPIEMFKDQGFEDTKESIDPNEVQRVQEPDPIQTDPLKAINHRGFEGGEEKKRTENEGEGAKRDESSKKKKNKCKLCDPLVLGSTIVVTISVLVIHLLRTQNPQRKRKN